MTSPEDGSIRPRIEATERASLSPYAALACESEGRATERPLDPVRTCFMRDRDRILHSKPFRRLKHKTQVFIEPLGDHYRTRLTHTLEVAQVARTIARALRLNEDLTEAIALGHDVGHTPFGHAGEFALDEALKSLNAPDGPRGFSHSDQSLRVVEVLDPMNLTAEVRAGIGGHSKGRKDLTAHDGEAVSTLEAAVVRVSDRIAYMNHDIDDAIRSGILKEVPAQFAHLGLTSGDRIGGMVRDAIEHSIDQPRISFSEELLADLNQLKEFLFENVYHRYPGRFEDIAKAQGVVRELFLHYAQPGNLPQGFEGVQGAVDYVSGMTDRFAMADFLRLRMPESWTAIQS